MSHPIATLKPLFLSEDETLALLDLCLMSAVEIDSLQERAVLKLTDLARRYLADAIADEEMAAICAVSQTPQYAVCPSRPAPPEPPKRGGKYTPFRWPLRAGVDRSPV